MGQNTFMNDQEKRFLLWFPKHFDSLTGVLKRPSPSNASTRLPNVSPFVRKGLMYDGELYGFLGATDFSSRQPSLQPLEA